MISLVSLHPDTASSPVFYFARTPLTWPPHHGLVSMDNINRQPALNLHTSSSPARPLSTDRSPVHRQSQSPFRYLHFPQDSQSELSEKQPSSPDHISPQSAGPAHSLPSPFLRQPAPLLIPTRPRSMHHSNNYTRPRGLRIANLLKPWVPIILYGITSLAFVFAIALYKTEVFSGQSFSP